MKKILKYFLLERNRYVKEYYEQYVQQQGQKGLLNKAKRFFKLLQLNFQSYSLNKRCSAEDLRFSVSVKQIVNILGKYDTISLDVFDTLLFRIFDCPKDVFLYMESKYRLPYFKSMRIYAEESARKSGENKEISLRDIYAKLEKISGLDAELWSNREVETEQEVCFANPYMLEVFQYLKQMGKEIIAVSDMYLPESVIREILENCGYKGIKHIFVSNEIGVSKADGSLYRYIQEKLNTKKVIHIGDNVYSDIQMAKENGWEAYLYPNVNRVCFHHPHDMSLLWGSLYRGIVNSHLNCGMYTYDAFYEYGYRNGGLLNYGYCQWINEYAKEKKVDKILFISRDGYIIHEVYKRYFNDIDSAYVLFSRYSAQQITFERYTLQYIEQTLGARSKRRKKVTIGQAFDELGLEFLSTELNRYNLSEEIILDGQIYRQICDFIYEHKSRIAEEFANVQQATYEYYINHIGDAKRILVVDLGWFGTCALALDYLLRQKYQTDIEVFSALVGGSREPEVDARMKEGHLQTYVFSSDKNVSLIEYHMDWNAVIHNILIEIMFTELKPSFLKFVKTNEGVIEPLWGYEETENQLAIQNMHKGMLQFAEEMERVKNIMKNMGDIGGWDAYAPLRNSMKNTRLCYNTFKDYRISQLSGKFSEHSIETVGDLMREYNYI